MLRNEHRLENKNLILLKHFHNFVVNRDTKNIQLKKSNSSKKLFIHKTRPRLKNPCSQSINLLAPFGLNEITNLFEFHHSDLSVSSRNQISALQSNSVHRLRQQNPRRTSPLFSSGFHHPHFSRSKAMEVTF